MVFGFLWFLSFYGFWVFTVFGFIWFYGVFLVFSINRLLQLMIKLIWRSKNKDCAKQQKRTDSGRRVRAVDGRHSRGPRRLRRHLARSSPFRPVSDLRGARRRRIQNTDLQAKRQSSAAHSFGNLRDQYIPPRNLQTSRKHFDRQGSRPHSRIKKNTPKSKLVHFCSFYFFLLSNAHFILRAKKHFRTKSSSKIQKKIYKNCCSLR